MPEEPENKIFQMFRQVDDVRINNQTGEVVAVEGFIKGQRVNIIRGDGGPDSVQSWKIVGFEVLSPGNNHAVIERGEGESIQRETIP